MEQARTEAIRADLERERTTVEHQLQEYGASFDPNGSVELQGEGGFADSAQATAGRSELLSLVEQLRTSHSEIVDAMRRIDEGIYGKCERCGEQIPLERLEARPTARLCVRCSEAVARG
ncbi:MAG: TraR/DksA family transcriptional regulator [Actinomycetota bacterium]